MFAVVTRYSLAKVSLEVIIKKQPFFIRLLLRLEPRSESRYIISKIASTSNAAAHHVCD